MDTKNGQESLRDEIGREMLYFLVHRGVPVVLLVMAAMISALVGHHNWQKRIDKKTSALADFQSVTGVAREEVPYKPPRERTLVWWQEYVLARAEFDELQRLARAHLLANEGLKFTGIQDDTNQKIKDSFDAFRARAEKLGHGAMEVTDFSFDDNRHWNFTRTVHPDEGFDKIADPVGLVGYLPAALEAKIPPTGRLEDPHGVAEFREYAAWNGEQISLSLLKEAAMERYPIEGFIERPDDPVTHRSNEQRKEYADVVHAATSIEGIEAATVKYKIPTFDDERYTYYGSFGLFLDLVRNGKIPVPKRLDQPEHDSLRKDALPGNQQFAHVVTFEEPYIDPAVAVYAKAKNLPPSEVAQALALANGHDALGTWRELANADVAIPAALMLLLLFVTMNVMNKEISRPARSAGANGSESMVDGDDFTADAEDGPSDPAPSPRGGPVAVVPEITISNRKPLMTTDVSKVHGELSAKAPFARGLSRRKNISVSTQTKEVVDADTNLIQSQADQIKTVLRNQNEIDELQEDGELGPLRKETKAAQYKAQIATHEYTEAEQRKKKEDLFKEPPAPLPTPAPTRKPSREDQAAQMKRAYERKVKEIESGGYEDEMKRRLLREAEEAFHSKLNKLYGK